MFFFGLKVLEERLPNKKLMSAAAWAGGSAVLGLGRRGPGGKRRTQASAGCSAAAASSALLVPGFQRSGKKWASTTDVRVLQ